MHGLSKGPQTKPDHTRLTETTPDHARPHGTIAADKDNSGRENRTCQNHFSSGILNEILAYPDSKTAGGKHANHIRNIKKSIKNLTQITSKIPPKSHQNHLRNPLWTHILKSTPICSLLGAPWGALGVTLGSLLGHFFQLLGICFPYDF